MTGFLSFKILFHYLGGRGIQRQREDIKGQGDEWDQGTQCEILKEAVKSFQNFN